MKNKYVLYSLLVLGGIFLGWLFFHAPGSSKHEPKQVSKETTKEEIWTCSMHPQIRMKAPGKCPICGMDLIPLSQSTSKEDATAIHLTRDAAELANVVTSVVSRQKPMKEVRLYGKVQADERLLQSQVAHIPGRIEDLKVNFTGETVRRGQTLALIYSPELVTAQQELLEAAKIKDAQPEIYEAAKERLSQWMLTDNQIASIEKTGKVQTNFPVLSNTSGIVTARRVNNGDHVAEGTVLFNIADLSNVWVMFDAYESDLPFLNVGDKLNFNVQALPGKTYTGKIVFIDPVIDPVNRVSKVRVEFSNASGQLKPEMFVTGIVNASLAGSANKIVIPRSAILWTGKRSIVYVKKAGSDEPIFNMREIELGPALGNSYVVMNGLSEGEEIVTQGTFSVDAAAQLEGKPSMMNSNSEKAITAENSENVVRPESSSVEEKFVVQLNVIVENYIVLKNALVKSDPAKARQAAEKVRSIVNKVKPDEVGENLRPQWREFSEKLDKQLNKIVASEDIEVQRTAFSNLTAPLYKAIKAFGLTEKTVYYDFCPMANGGRGAYWISEKVDIQNPYYGASMLTCGDLKETLNYP